MLNLSYSSLSTWNCKITMTAKLFPTGSTTVLEVLLYTANYLMTSFSVNQTTQRLLGLSKNIGRNIGILILILYAKYHVQIMLLFVYTTTRKGFVILTCRYFKLSWNTTALSQSNCRNFSRSSVTVGYYQLGRRFELGTKTSYCSSQTRTQTLNLWYAKVELWPP